MRKFLITSQNYTGQVEVTFMEDILCSINFTDCNMIPGQRSNFKRAFPVNFSEVQAFVDTFGVMCIESDFEVTFEMFWNTYKNKINKKRCIPVWDKMPKAKQVAAWHGIKQYDAFLKRKNREKLDPENYLKNETWENEYN